MNVTSRLFEGEADYARMRALLTDSFSRLAPRVYCTVGDLDWWRCTADDPQSIYSAQLWFDGDERVVGIAWPSLEKRRVELISDPAYVAREPEMLEWAET